LFVTVLYYHILPHIFTSHVRALHSVATVCDKPRNVHLLTCSITVVGLLARSQYPEGPATGYLGIGFSWFPYV